MCFSARTTAIISTIYEISAAPKMIRLKRSLHRRWKVKGRRAPGQIKTQRNCGTDKSQALMLREFQTAQVDVSLAVEATKRCLTGRVFWLRCR